MNNIKIALVTQIVNSISTYLKIPSCIITYNKMEEYDKNIAGVFLKDDYVININLEAINKLNELEISAVFIHEMRHAYQWCQIQGIIKPVESLEVIKQWRYEFHHYIHPMGDEIKYLHQAIEIDAIAFTDFFSKKYLKQNLIIPKFIEYKVGMRFKEIELQLIKFTM